MKNERIALRLSPTMEHLDRSRLRLVSYLSKKHGCSYDGTKADWAAFRETLRAWEPPAGMAGGIKRQARAAAQSLGEQIDRVLAGSMDKQRPLYHLCISPQPKDLDRPIFLHGKGGDWEMLNTSKGAKSFVSVERAEAFVGEWIRELRDTGLVGATETLVPYEPDRNMRRKYGNTPESRIR